MSSGTTSATKINVKGSPLCLEPTCRDSVLAESVKIEPKPSLSVGGSVAMMGLTAGFAGLHGFYTVKPNQVVAITHFGKLTYIQTRPGLHWNHFIGMETRRVSVKQLTMDLPHSKVVDSRGTPVMVSAIVNYRVVDAKKALFSVEKFASYVKVNATAILKQVVGNHTYDELKTHAVEVNAALREAVQQEVNVAGVEIISMSMNELNYAPEIAHAMLKKQQAGALIEARQLIVDGAVKIAQEAVTQLETGQKMTLTNDDKVRIVTNLLTVTCSDSEATPTISC